MNLVKIGTVLPVGTVIAITKKGVIVEQNSQKVLLSFSSVEELFNGDEFVSQA